MISKIAVKVSSASVMLVCATFIAYILLSLVIALIEHKYAVASQFRVVVTVVVMAAYSLWMIGTVKRITNSFRQPPVCGPFIFDLSSFASILFLLLFIPWMIGIELDEIINKSPIANGVFYSLVGFGFIGLPSLFVIAVNEIVRAEKKRGIAGAGGRISTAFQVFYLPIGIFWLKPRVDRLLHEQEAGALMS